MARSNIVFVGIKGSVVALDRATGTQIWSTSLKGADLVNVVLCDGELFAAARGEMFCLDPSTGHIRWHNPLKGYGYGLMTIAVQGGTGNQAAVIQKHQRQKEAAAAAAATSAS
jgi:outer membrane protein assembly factor BamB